MSCSPLSRPTPVFTTPVVVTKPPTHPVDPRVWQASGGLTDCIAEELSPIGADAMIVTALPPGRRELISFRHGSARRLRLSGVDDERQRSDEDDGLSDIGLIETESLEWLGESVFDSIAIVDPSRPLARVVFDLRARRGERLCGEPLAERLALLQDLARDDRWPPWWGLGLSGRVSDWGELASRMSALTGEWSTHLVRRLIASERELGRAITGAPFDFALAESLR